MDMEQSLSEDDKSIQTFNRSGHFPKIGMKVNKKTSKTGKSNNK